MPVINCWIWTRALRKGYGRIQVDGKQIPAHRFSYMRYVGPIPEKHEVDHYLYKDNLCIGPICVNPQHLETKDRKQHNAETPRSITTINANKTHCKWGHEFTEENTYLTKDGRSCKECSRTSSREIWRNKNPGYSEEVKVSKYKGVGYAGYGDKWRARYQKDGKRITLAPFDSEEEAYQALLKAKNKEAKK